MVFTKLTKDDGGIIKPEKGVSNEQILKKLFDYEKYEEDGRMLILPCAIGSTVYQIKSTKSKNGHWDFSINPVTATLDFIIKHIDDFGDTIFDNEEDANTAMQFIMKS